MRGSMERNVGGLMIYQQKTRYLVLDCRTCPYSIWGTLPLTFNVWQQPGQIKIFFLAHGDRNGEKVSATEEDTRGKVHVRRAAGGAVAVQERAHPPDAAAADNAADRG